MGKGYGSGRKPLNGEAVTEIEGNVGQGNIENLANGSDLAESEGAFAREATAENGRGDACRSCKLLVVHVAAQEQTVQFNVFLGIAFFSGSFSISTSPFHKRKADAKP
jgi:hypothetical protein